MPVFSPARFRAELYSAVPEKALPRGKYPGAFHGFRSTSSTEAALPPAFREFEFPRGVRGLGRYDFWHFDPGSLRTVLSEDDEAGARRGQVDADARPVVFRLGRYVADGSAYRIPQLYPSATPEVHRPRKPFSLGRADVIPVGPVGRPVQPQDFITSGSIASRFSASSSDMPATIRPFPTLRDAGSGVAPDFRWGPYPAVFGLSFRRSTWPDFVGVSDDGRAVVYERIQLFGGLWAASGGFFGQPRRGIRFPRA